MREGKKVRRREGWEKRRREIKMGEKDEEDEEGEEGQYSVRNIRRRSRVGENK